MLYAIVDIETTGGTTQHERIIEIAIFLFDGKTIVDTFQSLIHPEKALPPFITQLTGITNEMLRDAPRFFEVARKIYEMTEKAVFVAHNVNFDYWFVRHEFKRLGGNFNRKTLCTVRLSRKLLKGHSSYSLGKLCNDLNISIKNRHRAEGDAQATVELFRLLLEKGQDEIEQKLGMNISGLHAQLDRSIIDNLPENTGIYYFRDEKGNLIYIGKSKNIRQRVLAHFYNTSTRKALEMKNRIADIEYLLTGSELIALLKESDEIKQQKPHYNRAQRRTAQHYGIYAKINLKGYIGIHIGKTSKMKENPLTMFPTVDKAKGYLYALTSKYELCQTFNDLYGNMGNGCFHHEVGNCRGACIGKEPPESYNLRAENALKTFSFRGETFVIVDEGRMMDERSVVIVEHGVYLGFGFMESNEPITNLEGFKDKIDRYADNHDVRQIISTHLKNQEVLKIIRFS